MNSRTTIKHLYILPKLMRLAQNQARWISGYISWNDGLLDKWTCRKKKIWKKLLVNYEYR